MKLGTIIEIAILLVFIIVALLVILVNNEASYVGNISAAELLRQGNELYNAGRAKYNQAAQKYLEALKINPDIAEARLKLADIYYEYIWNYEALDELNKLKKIDPGNPNLYLIMGKVYNRLGDSDKASEAFSQAVAIQPGSSEAHYFLGTVYQQLNNEAEAIKEYEQAIHGGSDKASVVNSYLQLGRIYRAKPDGQDFAEKALKTALNIDSTSADIISELRSFYRNQAENYEFQGRFDKAAEKYEEMVKIDPENLRNVEIYLQIGSIYRSEEQYDKAAKAYEAVIKLDPMNFDAFGALKELELLKNLNKGKIEE